MTAQSPDESAIFTLDDRKVEELFGAVSPADACAAVLTEARMVLPDLVGPLDAELWGSDVMAAMDRDSGLGAAIVPAAEAAVTESAVALLLVLGVLGGEDLRAAAAAAAGRLSAHGVGRPSWAGSVGTPMPGDCWRYGDAGDQLDAVTMSFSYGLRLHVVSVLVDHGQGGAISNMWAGDGTDVLNGTRKMAREDPGMRFAMVSPADARVRVEKALAAGECPTQPEDARSIASLRALLRARIRLLPPR